MRQLRQSFAQLGGQKLQAIHYRISERVQPLPQTPVRYLDNVQEKSWPGGRQFRATRRDRSSVPAAQPFSLHPRSTWGRSRQSACVVASVREARRKTWTG